jgi:putative selenate reductase
MVSCVTLSTFHGCPADEIEAIAEHLLERHGVHVVIKLNPTLLGFEGVDTLLRGRLGYQELRLDRDAFARDLGWEQAVAMLGRLEAAAARRGLTIGAKLTNTLVVKNHRGRLAGETIYLSGPPLHVLAVTLADRLVRATGGRIPISFSAGIDADNFADAVACGFAPVTACTDLLKPTGYRRLPRYLKALEAEMRRLQVATVDAFVVARAAEASGVQHPPRAAARQFLASYARNLPDDPRYHAAAQRGEPRREASRLSLFDCLSCNACVVACPNDAMFSLALGPEDLDAPELEVTGSGLEPRPGRFVLTRNEQWAVYGDLCNDCGNCDTFCPEHGGPQRAKPRFFGAREPFVAAAADGLLLGEGGQVSARFGGASYELSETGSGARFSDGVVEALLDGTHRLVSARVLATVPVPGHRLPLWRYHAMRLLRDAALARAAWPRAALFDR